MISEKEFRSSGHKDALKDLLTNPTLVMALEIIGETAKPRGTVEPKPNSHLDTLVAQKFHKQSGIQQALDHLKRLTTAPEEDVEPEDALTAMPFFSTLPKPMQDALRERAKQHPQTE